MRFWLTAVRVGVVLLLARGLVLPAQAKNNKDNSAPFVAPPSSLRCTFRASSSGPRWPISSTMQPSPALAGKMLKVDGFQQRDPKDGAPISQKTEVYLGYTDKNLYVVCICFDSEPGKIRARLVRRELINDDDQFGFVLDTFHDHYHGLFFYVNPLGVQQDGIWVDNGQEPDLSYDMVWNSEAKLTGQRLRRLVRDSVQVPALSSRRHPEVGSVFRARHQAQQRIFLLPAHHQQRDRLPRPGDRNGRHG